jgi:hypothetical protein
LKLDGKEPVQPIFLMPKGSGSGEAQKPIYIPRNIYVPVIRPVFVPRERIIVRPQIIHVARPVLVDRPVPIQQRPIVIERDRPVPVRVETIEKQEPCGGGGGGDGGRASSASGTANGTCNEITKNIENGQEVTYHEFTQTFPQSSNNGEYSFNEPDVLLTNHLQSKSNEDLYKYSQEASKLENVLGASAQGYTLEVLDQRISDKFEKTDSETIKARYGVDSYQYLPVRGEESVREGAASSASKRSAAEFYSSNGISGSSKNLNEAKNSSSNIYSYDSNAASFGGVSPRK